MSVIANPGQFPTPAVTGEPINSVNTLSVTLAEFAGDPVEGEGLVELELEESAVESQNDLSVLGSGTQPTVNGAALPATDGTKAVPPGNL